MSEDILDRLARMHAAAEVEGATAICAIAQDASEEIHRLRTEVSADG